MVIKEEKTEAVRSLEYLKSLPTTRLAWEFLRRNPAYIDDHKRHQEGALSRRFDDNDLEILRLTRSEPEAEKWGLAFFASPSHNALTAPAFWTEKVSPHVVSVDVSLREPGDPISMINRLVDLRLFGCRRIHLTDADGSEHLLLLRGKRVVQLRCFGHSLLDDRVKLRFMLDGFGDIDAKFKTIKRLSNLYLTYTGSEEKTDGWTQTKLQLRDALIALDVHLAGGSYHEMAVAIYGKEQVKREASGPSSAIKSRMQRLRKSGINRMNGGYLDLMKTR